MPSTLCFICSLMVFYIFCGVSSFSLLGFSKSMFLESELSQNASGKTIINWNNGWWIFVKCRLLKRFAKQLRYKLSRSL